MHGEVVHFEVPAKDIKRAKAFYSEVFGWKTNDTTMPVEDMGWSAYFEDTEGNLIGLWQNKGI